MEGDMRLSTFLKETNTTANMVVHYRPTTLEYRVKHLSHSATELSVRFIACSATDCVEGHCVEGLFAFAFYNEVFCYYLMKSINR